MSRDVIVTIELWRLVPHSSCTTCAECNEWKLEKPERPHDNCQCTYERMLLITNLVAIECEIRSVTRRGQEEAGRVFVARSPVNDTGGPYDITLSGSLAVHGYSDADLSQCTLADGVTLPDFSTPKEHSIEEPYTLMPCESVELYAIGLRDLYDVEMEKVEVLRLPDGTIERIYTGISDTATLAAPAADDPDLDFAPMWADEEVCSEEG